MRYRIVIRHGRAHQRYHTLDVDAPDLAAALVAAAQRVPPELLATADLAEVREAPDPEDRPYLEEPSS